MQLFVYISLKRHHLDDTYSTLLTLFLIACADDIPDADSLKSYFLHLWASTERDESYEEHDGANTYIQWDLYNSSNTRVVRVYDIYVDTTKITQLFKMARLQIRII